MLKGVTTRRRFYINNADDLVYAYVIFLISFMLFLVRIIIVVFFYLVRFFILFVFFFFQAEDGIRDGRVTGVQTCALPIYALGGASREPPVRHGIHGIGGARDRHALRRAARRRLPVLRAGRRAGAGLPGEDRKSVV